MKVRKHINITLNDYLNEQKETDNWDKITVDDLKTAFPDKNFIDGGKVDDGRSFTDSIIISDVDTAIEILTYLDKKMYPYGIGGEPEDIKLVWDKFPKSTVKLALPHFKNKRYEQIISFVFEYETKYPPVFVYHSNTIGSPCIWKRASNTNWKTWYRDEWNDFFKNYL